MIPNYITLTDERIRPGFGLGGPGSGFGYAPGLGLGGPGSGFGFYPGLGIGGPGIGYGHPYPVPYHY